MYYKAHDSFTIYCLIILYSVSIKSIGFSEKQIFLLELFTFFRKQWRSQIIFDIFTINHMISLNKRVQETCIDACALYK